MFISVGSEPSTSSVRRPWSDPCAQVVRVVADDDRRVSTTGSAEALPCEACRRLKAADRVERRRVDRERAADTTLIDYGSGIWGLSSPTHPQDSNSPDSPDELFSSGIRLRHNGIRNPRGGCVSLSRHCAASCRETPPAARYPPRWQRSTVEPAGMDDSWVIPFPSCGAPKGPPCRRELVEEGLLTPTEFRLFACDNVIRLHGEMKPTFFDGTIVESYARGVLTESRS